MAKTKEEILDMYAKDKMVTWNLKEFKRTYPSLFAVIEVSMSEFAKQEAIAFARFLDEFKISRDSFINRPRNATTEELYTLYLTSK